MEIDYVGNFFKAVERLYGDKYDLSQVHYVNRETLITVVCREHGPFQVLPRHFLANGHRLINHECPVCKPLKPHPSNKHLSQEEWEAKARAKWGDAYDYSESVYNSGMKPITIRCKKHDHLFTVMAGNHIRTSQGRMSGGCPICSGYLKPGTFISKKEQKRIEAHERKVRRHAEALQRKEEKERLRKESKLLREQRALEREKRDKERALESEQRKKERKRRAFEHFVCKAREKHGDRYDYSEETERGPHGIKQAIICKEHGRFFQYRSIHVSQACGCPKCSNYPNHLSREFRASDFIRKSKEKFGDRYDYSKVMDMYVNNDTHVLIRCKEHDYEYSVTPDTHLRGASACPLCSSSEGEVVVRKWLDDHNVKYIVQYHVEHNNPECKRLYLTIDFYLPKHNMFIEYNGEQHYKEVTHFFYSRGWSIEDQQIRDQTLRDICKERGIRLLEIPYWEFKRIGEILDGENLTAEPAKHRKCH